MHVSARARIGNDDRSGIRLRFPCLEFNRAAIKAAIKIIISDRAIAEGLTAPLASPTPHGRGESARARYTKRRNAENSRCVRFPLDKRRHDAGRPASNIILQTRARRTFTYILERGTERERERGEGAECDTTFSSSLNYTRDYPARTNQTYRIAARRILIARGIPVLKNRRLKMEIRVDAALESAERFFPPFFPSFLFFPLPLPFAPEPPRPSCDTKTQ